MAIERNPGSFDWFGMPEPRRTSRFLSCSVVIRTRAAAVRRWADDGAMMIALVRMPAADHSMVKEARRCADEMARYCRQRAGRRPPRVYVDADL
jgi:hypothetical protein